MNVLSVLRIAFKRLWKNKGLALSVTVGLVAAVALIGSVPLYTDAANFVALQKQLAYSETGLERPSFAFMYRYIGAWHGAVEFEDYARVSDYVARFVPGAIGLPLELATQYTMTDNLALFAASEAAYFGTRQPLGWVNLGVVERLGEHVQLLEGRLPSDASADAEEIEALVSQAFAEQVGLQVGEEYIAFSGGSEQTSRPVQFRVRVSGVWAPIDEKDPFWFYPPRVLENALLVSPETFRLRIAPVLKGEVYAALWYLVFDGRGVRSDDVPALLERISYVNTSINNLLPNTSLDISPVEALQVYRWASFIMTILLYVFSVPILGLIFYFIGVISGLVVQRQQGEIAILKSRGAGDLQVLGIYALEGTMLGVVALAGGLPLGRFLASWMGNAVSFLSFGRRTPLPIAMTPKTFFIAVVGMGFFLLASIVPAMRAARLTLVSYKQDRIRALERPLWQRLFLDFFLLIPAGYGYYVLRNRGGLGFFGNNGDPFRDPFLFLVPTLAMVALSLVGMRLFPLLMELLAWVTSHVAKSVAVVLALRQLARASRQYIGALLLLTLTVGLAAFTASMARTFDQSLVDRAYYRYGADYRLVELGEPPLEVEEEETSEEATASTESTGWGFVPVSEHLRVEGVRAATRVGVYRVETQIGEVERQGVFYGIDRLDFPHVAFFRGDFAPEPLGALMNRLGANYAAVLVTPNFLQENLLNIGDSIELEVVSYGVNARVPFVIAGVVHYFPTYYPDEEENRYLFVGNLDYLFERMGGMYPYDVWLRTAYPLEAERAMAEMRQLDINVVRMEGSREAIEEARRQPDRTGVLGILSAGFIAAAVLTVLGFLLHSFISFQKRYIEFGVLRAIGFSVRQLLGFLSLEQALLILVGTTIGTALGAGVSHLFIPFLQVGANEQASIPPFVVLIAWGDILKIYLLFGLMLVCAIGGMLWSLAHLKVFEAVKLGEAV